MIVFTLSVLVYCNRRLMSSRELVSVCTDKFDYDRFNHQESYELLLSWFSVCVARVPEL